MTKQSIQQFSATAANNTDINGIDVNTGWPPGNVGQAVRTLMAMLASLAQPLTIALSGSSLTLTSAQASCQNITLTGSLSGTFTLTLPGNSMFGAMTNNTNVSVILTTGSGATLTLPTGVTASYLCDGVNVSGNQVVTEQANPGDMRFTGSLTTPALWQRCYGQAISRTTYALLFGALTYSTTGTTTSGSSSVASVAALPPNMDGNATGALVEGTGIPTGTTITAITGTGPYTLTLSASATASGTTTLRFLPYGQGDGATTFNVPDLRGRAPVGADGMGGSTASRVTSGVSGVNGALLGAAGGSQNAQRDTLVASSAATSTATSTPTDPGHSPQILASSGEGGFKTLSDPTANGVAGAGGNNDFYTTAPGGVPGANIIEARTTGITVATVVSTTVSTTVTSSLTVTSQNMPPVLVGTWIIYAGA